MLIALTACKDNERNDSGFINEQLRLTDSLNGVLVHRYENTLNGIYKLTEDSVLADSISLLVVLPDTFQFYEYLQYNISKLENFRYLTQQEIYFVQEQLNGLKEEVEEKQISSVQYELEIESQKAMLAFLIELVDSSLNEIRQIQNELLITHDSIPQ
jgi:hypothetical protein